MNNEWLQELKAGNRVHLYLRGNLVGTAKVQRLTKTQIIIDCPAVGESVKVRRENGIEVGNRASWEGWYRIEPFSQEIEEKHRAKLEKTKILAYLRQANYSTLSLDALREIEDCVRTCIQESEV